jgi:ankyrin repeat protein
MTQRDEYGRTELHYAAFDGPIDEVRIRIEQNADVNDRDNQQWTPLLFAAQMGRRSDCGARCTSCGKLGTNPTSKLSSRTCHERGQRRPTSVDPTA